MPSATHDERLAPLTAAPLRAAVLTDVDGTLAPIVDLPEQATVPDGARAALAELSGRFGLVGCISGRRAREAKELVGLDGIAYAGNHGLEILLEGDELRLDPSLVGQEDSAKRFVAELGQTTLAGVGLWVEDKGPIQSLHWRGAADERAAEARAHELAVEAGRCELDPHWGRKVLELRPLGGAGKASAVSALLADAMLDAAIYAGDDRTDLDAFRRLRELVENGALRTAVCVGVTSDEGPTEIAEEADFVVDGPAGWLAVLRELAG